MNKNAPRWLSVKWLCGAMVAVLAAMSASADPVLPYLGPLATELSNHNETAGLRIYHRASQTIYTDTLILRGLNDLLGSNPDYSGLLDTAANDYNTDFENRREFLSAEVLPAPLGSYRTLALRRIATASNLIERATAATTTSSRIAQLQSAGRALVQADSAVLRALSARVGLSSMAAKVAIFNFSSGNGNTVGTFTNGVLDVTGLRVNVASQRVAGAVVTGLGRAISIHLEGVTTNTPAVYAVGGEGANTARFTVSDLGRRATAMYQAVPSTNVPSQVRIEAITPTYMVGSFSFTVERITPMTLLDTNAFTVITNGTFQLNFQ